MKWNSQINKFLERASHHGVRMIMVGGGAVNFHGYQRHSADVDFWIETTEKNLQNLILVFRDMGFEIDALPQDVIEQNQNISIKFSPVDLNLELITRFEIGKSFEAALQESQWVEFDGNPAFKWNVLNLNDLLESKRRAGRPKDMLDIQELKAINKKS
jgi:predicted nucleotidyltransferase